MFADNLEVKIVTRSDIFDYKYSMQLILTCMMTSASFPTVISEWHGMQSYIFEMLFSFRRIIFFVLKYLTLPDKAVIKSMRKISYAFVRIEKD